MSVIPPPKGTRDFFPADMALQEYLFSSWKKTCERYGFELYDGPMFESKELYTKKSGEEIEKQLYGFTDKGDRELALRPEMTPTLARMAAAAGSNLKWPIRWYSIARVFRYEKMQRGRQREFFQLNMDILGVAEAAADAELIAAAIDMMKDLGLSSDDFKVRISSRTLLEELFISSGVPRELCGSIYALLDKKAKIPEDEFERELAAQLPDAAVRGKITAIFRAGTLDEIASIGGEIPSLQNLRQLFTLLATYGFSDYVLFDIGIVRGLAYYTGIVFELFDIKKSMRAIAGGGRYDKLVELYGGPATPAVGFAAGDVVLAELLREKRTVPPQKPRSDCFIVAVDEADRAACIALAQELRGKNISCEFGLRSVNIGKQLKIANSARSRFALFIGGDEGKAGKVKIKDMANGAESLVNRTDAGATISNLLSIR